MHAAGGPAGGAVDTIVAVAARCCWLWKKLHFAFSQNAIMAGTRSIQLVTASPMKHEHTIFGKSVLSMQAKMIHTGRMIDSVTKV